MAWNRGERRREDEKNRDEQEDTGGDKMKDERIGGKVLKEDEAMRHESPLVLHSMMPSDTIAGQVGGHFPSNCGDDDDDDDDHDHDHNDDDDGGGGGGGGGEDDDDDDEDDEDEDNDDDDDDDDDDDVAVVVLLCT
eukprot:762502-Hanusia_phi.AAC.1